MSEVQYETTDWFNKEIKPVYEGIYEVKVRSWPFPHKAYWNGTEWREYFGPEDDIVGTKLKIIEWRGLTEQQSL